MQGAHKDELDPALWELTGYKEETAYTKCLSHSLRERD